MLIYWLLFCVFALGALLNGWREANPRPNPGVGAAVAAGSGVAAFRPPLQQHSATPWLGASAGQSPRSGAVALNAATLLTIVIIGFRWEVGGDWYAYVPMFHKFSQMHFWQALGQSDPGYALINWICARLGYTVVGVNVVCATIFCVGVTRFARQQPNPWLAYAVAVPYLIIVVGMGYTRQAVAIGLIIMGLASLHEGSVRKFIFWVLLAVTFHRTAIVVLPVVGVANSRNRFEALVLTLIAVGVGYFAVSGHDALEHFERDYVSASMLSQGAATRLAMNVPAAVIFLISAKRFGLAEGERLFWFIIAVAAIGCTVMLKFVSSTTALDRIALYLIPLQLMVLSRLPTVMGSGGRPSLQMTFGIIMLYAMTEYVWLNHAVNAPAWVPYQTALF